MAKAYLRCGYEIQIVPVELADGLLYTVDVFRNGEKCTGNDPFSSPFELYSESTADSFMQYIQSLVESEECCEQGIIMSAVNSIYYNCKINYRMCSLRFNRAYDKFIWQV